MRERLTASHVFSTIDGGGKGLMSTEKDNNWGNFIRRIRKSSERNSLVNKLMEETQRHDAENFLFISSGSGMIIRGMHYPDSAFGDEEAPVIFKTSEENVLIAAWPRSLIKIFLEIVIKDGGEKNLETEWTKALEVLSTVAELKIKNGEINEYF